MKFIRPILVNRHKEPFDIYIGRGTMWGNKFEVDNSKGWTRSIVIEMYREYFYECLENGTITVEDILSLSGKVIACSCKPKNCHGDVILEVFDEIIKLIESQNKLE